MVFLTVDIGGTFVKYALADRDGHLSQRGKIPTEKRDTASFLESLVHIYQQFTDIEGIALSSCGVVDSDKGILQNGGSLNFIKDLHIVKHLEENCQVPVSIENDAKCAALAEFWKGSLVGTTNSLTVVIGTAVGGALIIDKKLVKGSQLLAGELSYIMTDSWDTDNPSKNLANCGGVPYFIQLVAQAKELNPTEISGEDIFRWIAEGDEWSFTCLDRYTKLVASQLVNLHFIVNPDKFAIGGGISEQPLFLQLLEKNIEHLLGQYPFELPKPTIVACQFNNDANLLGALYTHLNAI